MKKILIPILGLFVLILLTPFILGKIANSNIDKKIDELKKEGIQIKELKKEISYLNSERVFEIKFDKKTKLKSWQVYKNLVKSLKLNIKLSFKNLPVTTAKFDIKLLNTPLKNLKIKMETKDLKHFKYKINENYLVLNGETEIKKFAKTECHIEKIKLESIKGEGIDVNLTTKGVDLWIFEGGYKVKKIELFYKKMVLKVENGGETFKNYLTDRYHFRDKYFAEKFEIGNNKKTIFKVYKLKGFFNSDYDRNFSNIEIETNSSFNGGNIYLKGDLKKPYQLEDTNLIFKAKFSKEEFNFLTKEFDPEIVKHYFKNYQTEIVVKKGVVKIK